LDVEAEADGRRNRGFEGGRKKRRGGGEQTKQNQSHEDTSAPSSEGRGAQHRAGYRVAEAVTEGLSRVGSERVVKIPCKDDSTVEQNGSLKEKDA